MDKIIKVILADDHQNILKSISYLLNNSPNIEVVATAGNGEDAVTLALSTNAEILILDIDMPKLNGLQVLDKLRSLETGILIVILSIYNEPSIVKAAFKLGARGYVLKYRAATDLVEAIWKVMAGETYTSKAIA